jgi:uncharacterized protein (DUF924 family)
MMCGTRSKTEIIEPTWVGEVIHFWFEELGKAHWFTKIDHIDARIHDRFLRLHERLLRHNGLGVTAPRQFLSLVIVLDQFSRNLYRGNPCAFSADSIARRLSRTAIEQGFDIAMKREERYFLYLPFEHSEDREDQTLALNLIKRLANEEWTRYAMAHKVVIDRFGRFPHVTQYSIDSRPQMRLRFWKANEIVLSSVTVGTASATLASGRFRAANLSARVSTIGQSETDASPLSADRLKSTLSGLSPGAAIGNLKV